MAYQKVSVPKNGDGAGCAAAKSSEIIIIDAEDIVSEPTRTVGNVVMEGDYTLKEDAESVSIYATAPTIDYTEEYSGDPDARGVKQGIGYEHPGNSVAIKNHTEAYMNKGVVILNKECDGSADGRVQAFGSKCNPLYMTPETTNNKEACKRKFVWKQEQASKFLPGDYKGKMPKIAAEAAEPTPPDQVTEGA
ncbi:hypothetical protein [Alistipes putredinis]|uniref:hypothetical protein n=1 Tax=Alistipes putredinis TaxID=28117 RepID=UPI003AB6DC85